MESMRIYGSRLESFDDYYPSTYQTGVNVKSIDDIDLSTTSGRTHTVHNFCNLPASFFKDQPEQSIFAKVFDPRCQQDRRHLPCHTVIGVVYDSIIESLKLSMESWGAERALNCPRTFPLRESDLSVFDASRRALLSARYVFRHRGLEMAPCHPLLRGP